jgi:hypothetical protein
MGLILFGLGLGWAFVLVAVVFLLLVVAVVAGGLPALLVYAVAGLITQGAVPWIAAAVVGLPIFIVILAVPLAVLGGWAETFKSSAWTLTYRELLALEAARLNGASGKFLCLDPCRRPSLQILGFPQRAREHHALSRPLAV